MSRAFVKEQDGADVIDDLPDRPVPPGPNLVTAEGCAAIETEIARLQDEFHAAGEDRVLRARIARDLRYWTARRTHAVIAPPPEDKDEVRFGARVSIERDDGRAQTFRIVGEDEADPELGSVSHASPLARALMGKSVGDVVRVGEAEIEIIAID